MYAHMYSGSKEARLYIGAWLREILLQHTGAEKEPSGGAEAVNGTQTTRIVPRMVTSYRYPGFAGYIRWSAWV